MTGYSRQTSGHALYFCIFNEYEATAKNVFCKQTTDLLLRSQNILPDFWLSGSHEHPQKFTTKLNVWLLRKLNTSFSYLFTKNVLLIKQFCFSSDFDETLWDYSTHEHFWENFIVWGARSGPPLMHRQLNHIIILQ